MKQERKKCHWKGKCLFIWLRRSVRLMCLVSFRFWLVFLHEPPELCERVPTYLKSIHYQGSDLPFFKTNGEIHRKTLCSTRRRNDFKKLDWGKQQDFSWKLLFKEGAKQVISAANATVRLIRYPFDCHDMLLIKNNGLEVFHVLFFHLSTL